MSKNFKIIGKRVPNIDGPSKAAGRAVYVTDLRIPGMLFGRILKSPYAHARIVNVDTAAAEKLQGVKAVVTAADTPLVKFGIFIDDELPLAHQKVRFVGEGVAAVAAIDEDTAEEALSLIRVEYEPLPSFFCVEEAMAVNALPIHDEKERNIAFKLSVVRGDVELGFAEADFISIDEFTTSLVHTAPIEPNGCIAQYDDAGRLTVWAPLQDTGRSLFAFSKALGLPIDKIRIVQPAIGGAFGGKNGMQPLFAIAPILAKKSGEAVQLINNRQEDMETGRPAVPMKIWSRIGVTKDGVLCAKETKIVADNGAYSSHGPGITIAAAVRFDSVYRQKNLKTEAKLVYTNNVPTGAYRGYGATQVAFALESHLDMIAKEIGVDPLALRLANATRTGDISVHGWKISSAGLDQCIQTVAKASRWHKRSRKRSGRGMGLAASIHVSGLNQPTAIKGSKAQVEIGKNGRVLILAGETEIGQGARTIFAQIAAQELGLPISMVDVLPVDTDVCPRSLGTFSSRVTVMGGNAVMQAARDAKKRVLELASSMLDEPPESLTLKKGIIASSRNSRKKISIKDLAVEAGKQGVAVIGQGEFRFADDPPDKETFYGNLSANYSFAAHIAEVEVDKKTGLVHVLRFFCAHDIGRALNPMACEGQIEGGVLQGLGHALMEEVITDRGVVLNPNFTDYKIPRITDAPYIKTFLIETNDPIGPFGAKGLAEEVTVPVSPAIANAIYDAVGVRIKDLPITPEKILSALRRKDK
jgi:CO/xanthine dehydrogenase Mo-binding subunit